MSVQAGGDMPVRGPAVGDRFIQAERKNRVERARLDLQLKIYEREKLRNWGVAEREKKSLLTNIESVKRTTGLSDMGVEVYEKDNAYEASAHSRSGIRLSEKRLMEWKLIEKQLQRFLKHKAVSVDGASLNSRQTSSACAWNEEKKPPTVKERLGGKVDKERKEVEKRVNEFLDGKVSSDENGSSLEEGNKAADAAKITGRLSNRQRHQSEYTLRPHTAFDKEVSPGKPPRRPVSAYTPQRSRKSSLLVTKGDVFLKRNMLTPRDPVADPDTPRTRVNNFMQGPSRPPSSLSSDSESEHNDIILYEDRNLSKEGRADGDDTASSKSSSSDKCSRKLSKLSVASNLDRLTEVDFESDLPPNCQSTFRSAGVHSAQSTTCKSALHGRPKSRLYAFKRDVTHQRETTPNTYHEESEYEETVHDRSGKSQRETESLHAFDANVVTDAVRTAMVFSKSARKRALQSLVNQNSPDKREIIRQERIRRMKSRTALLATLGSRFNIK